MTTGGLRPRLDLFRDTLERPSLFHALRFALVGAQRRTKAVLAEEIAAVPGERVLDVCCGIGEFAAIVPRGYTGIDLNPHFISYARGRHPDASARSFEARDATRLGFPDGHFDVTICVNSLHHFSDEAAVALLREIRRVTRCRALIVDADGTPRGLLRRALLAADRGDFMRTPAALASLVGRVFAIEAVRRWEAGFYTEILFRCPVGAGSPAAPAHSAT